MTASSVLPNLTVQQLEYLVAADDADTHAQAAASLGVSASALSQGLAEASRRLGIVVFERHGRHQRVRSQARPVIDHARRVLALTSDLASYIERTRSGRAGRVRLGMIDAAAIDHFGEVLHGLRSEHHELDLHLTVGPSGGLFTDLEQGRLDVVVGVEPDRPIDGVAWSALMTEDLRVYAPPGVTRPGPPAGWGPWVTFPAGSHTRVLIARALRDLGATFDVVAESHQPEVLREMVSLDLGWTVLPAVQAEREPGALVPTSTTAVAERVLVVAWRDSSVTAETAIVVRDALMSGAPGARKERSG